MKLNAVNNASFFSTDRKNILLLVILWAVCLLIINPLGNFPLNDDWSYATAVKGLVEKGKITFTGWMGMTLFAQVLWGALWCKIFGFSFVVLRFSTLFLSIMGGIYTYTLIRKFSTPIVSFITALLVLFNPIYFNLSYTFMTDVPFFTFTIMSIFHLLCYVENRGKLHIVFAFFLAMMSVLTRQFGLMLGLGFFLFTALHFKTDRKLFSAGLIFFLLQLGLFIFHENFGDMWIGFSGRYFERNKMIAEMLSENPLQFFAGIFNRSAIAILYVSLFMSPLLVFRLKEKKLFELGLMAVAAAFFYIYLDYKDYIFPIVDNIIHDFGLGPNTLYDYWYVDETVYPHWGENSVFWKAITYFSCFFMMLFLHEFYALKDKMKILYERQMLLIIMFVIYTVVSSSLFYYDRYFLLPIPLLVGFLWASYKNETDFKVWKFSIFFLPFALFAIFGTHDYISWNSARWNAINHLLEEKKVHHTKIDGGFEFNGWYNYNEDDFPNGLKNLWVHDVDYIIAFEKLPQTEIIYEASYSRWLHLDESSIKVLRKL